MSHACDIVAYTFKADTYCPDCIVAQVTPGVTATAEDVLKLIADLRGIERMDEWSFDSGDFPKVVFGSQVEEPERCGSCGREIH